MKQEQRHCHARKIRTVNEGSYSDHKPKMLVLKMRTRRKWRSRGDTRKKKIAWEKLKDEAKREEFNEKTRQLYEMQQHEFKEDQDNWNIISDILGKAAEEVCGRERKSIENPWNIGHEEEISQMRREITDLINRRNQCQEGMRTRNREQRIMIQVEEHQTRTEGEEKGAKE